MRPYILDTSVLIAYEQAAQPAAGRLLELLRSGESLCTCAITLTEFYTGAPRGSNPRMDTFIDHLTYLNLTPEMAATAASYRSTARANGRRHATPDALIAALTKHTAGILLTNNVRDFPQQDITVERLGSTAA